MASPTWPPISFPLLASSPRPLLLPGPHDDMDYPSVLDLLRSPRGVDSLIYYGGKLRPVEEIMMACCAAMGMYARHTMLPAPDVPSSLKLLDSWARFETALLSPALRVSPDPSGSGLAVVTKRAVQEGHALVRLPSRGGLALTADGAVRALPKLLNDRLEAHVSIAAWLMRLIDAPPARLQTYLRALRSDAEVDCTLRWGEDELARLQTSLARSRARKLQDWADAQWRALFDERRWAWQSMEPPFNASYDRWTWALCAVWSRSFHLRCEEPTCDHAAGASGGAWRVFAPGADLLNYGSTLRGTSNAVLMQPAGGIRPEAWRKATFTPDDDEQGAASRAEVDPAAAAITDTAAPSATDDGSRGRQRSKARMARARSLRSSVQGGGGGAEAGKAGGAGSMTRSRRLSICCVVRRRLNVFFNLNSLSVRILYNFRGS